MIGQICYRRLYLSVLQWSWSHGGHVPCHTRDLVCLFQYSAEQSLIYFVQIIVEVGIAFCVTNSPVTEHHSRVTLKWSTEKPYCHYVPLLFYVVSTSGLSLHDSTMREVVNNLTIFHLISMQNQTDLHKFVVDWPVSLFCDRSDWLLLTYPPPSLQGKSVEACQSDWLPEQIDRSVYIYLLSLVTCSYNLLVQRNQLLQLGKGSQ